MLTFRGSVVPFKQLVFMFGLGVSFELFIYGPRYSVKRKRTLVLIIFLSGTAKLVIWKTRKNKLLGQDAILVQSKCGSYVFGTCGS